MKFSKYQKKVNETSNYSQNSKVILPAMWAAEETGEILHEIRQVLKDPSRSYDIEKITDEIGDLFICLSNLASDLEIDLDDVAEHSLEKLAERVLEQEKEGKGLPGD